MAGDWIPFTKDLPRKPEVLRIAAMTGLERRLVVYMLMEFWAWCDEQTEDGFLPALDVRSLSALHADMGETFFRTMSAVGWLLFCDDGVRIPNFDYWMGNTAKRRLKEARRKSCDRNSMKTPREMSASHADTKRTRRAHTEQNRTVEEPPCPPEGGGVVLPPALQTKEFRMAWERWFAYLHQRGKLPVKMTTDAQLERCAEWGPQRAVFVINHSIERGYGALIPPTEAAKPAKAAPALNKTTDDIVRQTAEARARQAEDVAQKERSAAELRAKLNEARNREGGA